MAVIEKNLGPVSAYAVAVANGYEGTEEQWAAEIAAASQNAQAAAGSATEAAGSAAAAAQSVTDANNAKTAAQQAAESASAAYGTDLLAATFAADAPYVSGQYVIYNGGLYVFTADHPAGAWIGTDASQVKVGGELTDLKSAFNDSVYRKDATSADIWVQGGRAANNGNGVTDSSSTYAARIRTDWFAPWNGIAFAGCASDYSMSVYAKDSGGTYLGLWDNTDKSFKKTSVSSFWGKQYYIYEIIAAGAKTISFVVKKDSGDNILPAVGVNVFYLHNRIQTIDDEIVVINSNAEKLGYKRINYFDPSTVTEGKYLTKSSGGLESNENYFTSDYIDVSELNTVKIYGSRFVCCYDANKSHLGSTYTPEADTRNSISAQTLETGTKYIRVSTTNSMLNILQVGEEISESFLVDNDNYFLNSLILKSNQIKEESVIVDLSGKGDYTSFTLACKENYQNNKNIIVKAGTYNIVSEYVAIWGQDAVDSMADADGDTFDGWQYGVKMNNRKFTFMPGAKLVLDWTGHTVDGTHRFSALRVERNVEIIGLDLDCTATFYAIHDDFGNNSEPYTVTYRNCRVIGHNLSNVNCIGGGCKKWSRHILDNCYFDNNTTVSTAVRYHNTNAEGAVPEIYVSNCYFGTYFRANYYGSQTSKMRVYVNNCQAKKIYKGAEGSASVDNVELHKWCNTETEPEETQNDL